MALLDSYATAAEYRSRTNKTDTADDTEILAQLTGNSRLIESKLNVCPGFWNASSANTTRYFTGRYYKDFATNRFYLVDDDGRQHCISTIDTDGVAVDVDGDGTYDYTIDPTSETWLVACPTNAALFSEPWDSLELLQHRSGATFTRWPTYQRSIKITGTWGWAAVPVPIKELVVKMTRDVRDSEEAGAAGSLSGVALKTDTWRLWLSVEKQYGYPPRVFA